MYDEAMRLDTDRLVLREFHEDDAHAVLAYQRTPEYQRLRKRASYTVEEATAFVATFISWQSERPRQRFQLAISLKSDSRLIGTCGIRIQRAAEGEATIGYELDPAYWGHGYATEAAMRMLAFGFSELGLQRVVAWCHMDNGAPIHIMEKIGFRREGKSSDSDAVPERWRNHYRLALSGLEWRARATLAPSIAMN
jgi:[ribosomal protein S5]-alanine N-acetyltransferase